MIKTNEKKYDSIKEIRERERLEKEAKIKEQCEAIAQERYGPQAMAGWSNEHKGLWFLPIMNAEDQDKVEFLLVLKPINRGILSYATTKIADEGLYSFLEQCMRECKVAGDDCVLDDDEFFLPAANKFNAIIEGRKAAMIKR